MLNKDDLEAIGKVVDVKLKTSDVLIKGEIKSVRDEIKAVGKRVDEAKEELRAEILAARAEAKADVLSIDAKLVKRINSHETRLEHLEENAGLTNPHKN